MKEEEEKKVRYCRKKTTTYLTSRVLVSLTFISLSPSLVCAFSFNIRHTHVMQCREHIQSSFYFCFVSSFSSLFFSGWQTLNKKKTFLFLFYFIFVHILYVGY